MNLQELQEKGAFVSSVPVKTEVTWTRTEEEGGDVKFNVHILRRSYGVLERAFKADPDDPERSVNAQFISNCVFFGDDAKEQMTYEQAFQLEPSLAGALMQAVREVNGLGRTEAKN